MIVLHLLQNSLPKISGSTIRTKYIFKYQKDFVKIIALTSFLFNQFKNDIELIEGIPHFRVKHTISSKFKFISRCIKRFNLFLFNTFHIMNYIRFQDFIISFYMKNYIDKLVKFYNVDIIHAHSHYLAGKYGLRVAKKRKIPFIYEVRGFIEENIVANFIKTANKKKQLSYSYNVIKKNETDLMKKSDLLITLSESMKNEILERDIAHQKIKIIPNGTDTEILKPIPINQKLKKELGLENHYVVGFIGRIIWYEGIEVLLKSISYLIKEIKNIKILLVGNIDKTYYKYLYKLSKEMNISKHLIYVGRVPHEKIKDYYSIIDIIVLPRINFKVCRIVTPLKPIEAMAFKTLVIASDFPAFRSIITPKETGDLFEPENPEDLAFLIKHYIRNPNLKVKIENFAREYIEKNYSWKEIIPKYKDIYLELLKKN